MCSVLINDPQVRPEQTLDEGRERMVAFYNSPDVQRYGRDQMPEATALIAEMIKTFGLDRAGAVVVDLGCGRGSLQDCHPSYVGLDLSWFALRTFLPGKRRLQTDIERLPLADRSADLVVSFAALEHVPNPEQCPAEIDQVLKPGGMAILAPAWFCRPSAAKGLPVKSYKELDWPDKLSKVSIPVRNHILVRSLFALPRRLIRELSFYLHPRPLAFTYTRLTPNLQEYVYTDCDAFVSMDPHAAMWYYRSRHYRVTGYETICQRLFVRHVPLVVRKPAF